VESYERSDYGRGADRPNLCEERQLRTDLNSVYAFRAGVQHSVHHDRLSVQRLDSTWQIRPAIGPAVNSDNLRIIGPLFFVYKEWPSGERRLSLLGIDGILLFVSHRSVLQPERLS
jgi:hypothetical protein